MIHKVTFLNTQSKNDHFCTGFTAACLQDLISRGKENGKLMGFLFIASNLSRVGKKTIPIRKVWFTDNLRQYNAAEKNATCSRSMETEKHASFLVKRY